jgi:uncharacterized membrane protein
MKKLQMISFIVLVITVAGMAVHAFLLRFPDWFVRVTGILMLIALFATVFSSVRMVTRKGRH